MKSSKILIYKTLKEDTVLSNLVNGNIFYVRPQHNIKLPSVIFWEVTGVKDREHNFMRETFQIDIFAKNNADEIAERVDYLLDGKRLKNDSGDTVIIWIAQTGKGEDFKSDVFHKYLMYEVITNLNV